MNKLFTVGYEGLSIDTFVTFLKQEGVQVLLDVREIALSRKKGFSKSALREAMNDAGIEYRHERDLGSPKPMRDKLKQNGDYKAFFEAFALHLEKQENLLLHLAQAINGAVALMCYESDYRTCHRMIVAERLEILTGLTPEHLDMERHGTHHKASLHTRQSIPTTQPTI